MSRCWDTHCKALSLVHDDDVNYFHPFKGDEGLRPARVVDVYDGDTCRLALCVHDDPMHIAKFNARLEGIDTPEMRGKTKAEKVWAKKARDHLRALVLNQTVKVSVCAGGRMHRPLDPRKRLIVKIFCEDGESVATKMVDAKYAVPYMDGSKNNKDYTKPDWETLAKEYLDQEK